MTGEAIRIKGSVIVLEAAVSSAYLASGSFVKLDSNSRLITDSPGYCMAEFEFVPAASAFSAALTAGAIINIFEQTTNSDGDYEPDPDANDLDGFIGSIRLSPDDLQQKRVSRPMPVSINASYYCFEFVDGGAGVARGGELLHLLLLHEP